MVPDTFVFLRLPFPSSMPLGYNRRMDKSQKEHAAALAVLQRWLWHILLFLGLTGWAITEPPPGRWMPAGAFLVFTFTVVIREIVLFRQRRQDPCHKNPPPDSP